MVRGGKDGQRAITARARANLASHFHLCRLSSFILASLAVISSQYLPRHRLLRFRNHSVLLKTIMLIFWSPRSTLCHHLADMRFFTFASTFRVHRMYLELGHGPIHHVRHREAGTITFTSLSSFSLVPLPPLIQDQSTVDCRSGAESECTTGRIVVLKLGQSHH
jgi:hypothetical protein